ncbi:glycogen/starch/alpha-glucan phosphorylase [Candidatus Saccharibacteria bacterium]|nr:glycogen/starch/alpha-glucan phosphorylase [Candidatus Saccharibacteria bacterium]
MKRGQYVYLTLEYYDAENGIRGGGGLGVLAADTRRIADRLGIDLTTVTPFYPTVSHQTIENGVVRDEHTTVDFRDYGFRLIDYSFIWCDNAKCKINILEKKFNSTSIIAVYEPGLGELYQDASGSDHRLYQEVALGFGGYYGLTVTGHFPNVMQLNEVATFFGALAWLDDLAGKGMDFYEALVYVRSHTLYTNHTLVQAAEAEFSLSQFERYVFPNLHSDEVKRWLKCLFVDDKIKLSTAAFEIAAKRSGVSKLHAAMADYKDAAGVKIDFVPITNGIDMDKWVMPETLHYYRSLDILDEKNLPTKKYLSQLGGLTSGIIRGLKSRGREILNEVLSERPDQNGKILHFDDDDYIFDFKRRFVDYKRPEMPFSDITALREVLMPRRAHYIIAGRVHDGDTRMMEKLKHIFEAIETDDFLKDHVHYLVDYDENLAFALSVGSNTAVNLPVVGLEACGTSWMKDVANLNVLISTNDGGVADLDASYHFDVGGEDFDAELKSLYAAMKQSISVWDNDNALESTIRNQLGGYLPVISGTRMIGEYLDYFERA